MQEQNYSHKGWQRILLFIIPYLFVVGLFQYAGYLIAGLDITDPQPTKSISHQLIIRVFDLVGTLLVLYFFMTFLDKKPFVALGFQTHKRQREFWTGIAIGFLIMLTGYSILYFSSEITVIATDLDATKLIQSLVFFSIIAVVEESIFRGYILRNLMLSMPKYIALSASALVFALMHAFNPNVSGFALFNIFLAGILLGLSYVHTKNLWFPIALHLSWNLFQSLFGFNVSGQGFYSVVKIQVDQANGLNGGAFGFEGSYIAVIAQLITIAAIAIYYNFKRKTDAVTTSTIEY